MKKLNLLLILSFLLISVSYGQYSSTSPLTCFPAPVGSSITGTFTSVPQPSAAGTVTLLYQGDIDNATEFLRIYDENLVLIGQTIPSGVFANQCKATLDSITFPVTIADLSSWAADGIITFTVTPQTTVSTTLCTPCSGGQVRLDYAPLTADNDAAMASVDSPKVFCAGPNNVAVTVRNSGTNQLDSLQVNWELNGVAQTSLLYIGLLDTLGGAFPNFASVNLGSGNFIVGSNSIKAWTSLPNGVADTSNVNDTIYATVVSASAPTSVSLSNATLNSIDVNAVGGAGTINYEYGVFGFTLGTGTTGSSPTANFTIGGLSQGTAYQVYVRSNCGSGDVSAYVGPRAFNTSFGVPYFQDFENWNPGILNNPLPEGWSSSTSTGPRWEAEDATGANENSFATGPFYDNTTPTSSGGMYLYLETSTGAGIDTVKTPPIYIDTNLSTVEVGFSYHMFGAAMGTLEVYVERNGVRTLLTSFIGQQQVAQPDGFIRYSSLLNGYQGTSVQLVFVGIRGTSFTSDMSIDDITIDPVLALNAGVVEVQHPVGNLCPGPLTPIVGVKNFGSNVIDSVNVIWDVNGVIDSLMYVGTILPGDTASVSLASVTISSTLVYDLEFYTNRPNNAADQFAGDDTLKVQGLRTGLSGTITLNPSLAASATNLISFAQLGQVLSNYGVCGATTINVASGTYNAVLEMNNVPGMSATNTLTIDGGDSATTTLENNLANDNAVVSFNSASYVTIKNLTVRSTRTNTSLHFGVHLGGGSNFDSLVNVRVIVNPTATFNVYGVGASLNTTTNFGNGDHANNFVMMNSSIDGGDWNVMFRGNGGNNPGAGSSGWNQNNQFIGNTLTNADDYGFYLDDQEGMLISGNTISDLRTTSNFTGYGMILLDGMNFKITGNNIVVPYTGIYVTNANSSSNGTRTGYSEVSNNMVSCVNNSGIWLQRPILINIWNNSVYCGSTDAFDGALFIDDGFGTPVADSLDIRNNALSSTTYAFRLEEPDAICTKFDNNSFYSTGANPLFIDGVLYSTLSAYTFAQPAFNGSSLDGDPQFISTTNLHVVGTFLNGAGDNSVPISTDIDGDSRPRPGSTAIDIGADEFDPPTCPPSIGLGVINVTLNSADVFWNGIAMDYEYEVVLAGAGQGTGPYLTTILDSITLTGLTPSTSYDFYTREICGRGDTSSWIGPLTFGTSIGVPFVEDFQAFPNGGSPFINGWTNNPTGPNWQINTQTGSFATGPVADHTIGAGGKFIYLETSTGNGQDELTSPSIYIDTNQHVVEFSFWYHKHGATMNNLEVYIETNNVQTLLTTIVGQTHPNQTDPWLQNRTTLAGYAGSSVSFMFRGIRGTSFTGDMAIDDVTLIEPSPFDASITDIISPTTGCGLGAADSVKVEISNVGTTLISNFPVVYKLNTGAPVVETYLDTILPGVSVNYTFNTTANLFAFGTYNFEAYTNLASDGDISNDTLSSTFNNIPLVASFPYFEDFNLSDGGWTSSGNNNSWAWGTPAGAVITGTSGAWVTNLSGNYNNNEVSFIESPCLNLSSLSVDPILSFSMTYITESCCDEGWIDVSIDGGFTWSRLLDNGGASQWYNDVFNQWWDGTSSGGAGVWVNAENILTGLAGESSVKIRIGFSSDASVLREGFGIDNIRIDLPAAKDMTVFNIVSPVSGAYGPGLSDSVRVMIANVGADSAINFTMNYVLNNGPVQTETVPLLLSGDTVLYTFNSSVPLPGPGITSILDVYVDFPLDSIYTNDSIIGYTFENDIKGIPYSQGFETFPAGLFGNPFPEGWSTTTTTDPNWESEDATGNNENSLNTGPLLDHTLGVPGGMYMYMETSGGTVGDSADLISPTILVPATTATFEIGYWYFNFGANIDRMEVLVEANGIQTIVRTYTGATQTLQSDPWLQGIDTITGYAGQQIKIIFRGFNVSCCTGDIAIDDFEVANMILVGLDKNESDLEGISISPNPSTGIFTLNIETIAKENFNMTVRDAQGREVYTENLNVNGTYRNDLDFTSFAKGVYFMQIQTETGSKVEKLVIQ